jgi:hypothetical protein
MADFEIYRDAFSHAKLTRSPEGVLEVVQHTNCGTLIFNGYTHEEFVGLFHQISQDVGNRVVVLTGAGDAFIDRIDAEGFDFFSPRGYDKIYREGKKVLLNLIDIPVPVIAALNGPTTIQFEYVLICAGELGVLRIRVGDAGSGRTRGGLGPDAADHANAIIPDVGNVRDCDVTVTQVSFVGLWVGLLRLACLSSAGSPSPVACSLEGAIAISTNLELV